MKLFRSLLCVSLLGYYIYCADNTCDFETKDGCGGWERPRVLDGADGFIRTSGDDTANATIAPLVDVTHETRKGKLSLRCDVI